MTREGLAIAFSLVAAGMPGAVDAQSSGVAPRTLYVLHCSGCHAMDGSGVPDKGVPTLRGSLGHFLRLREGRAFLVQVPGANNAGLSDEQIAAVTNWTVQQFSADTAPQGWSPYTAEEVAGARRNRPVDVAAARARLVERLRSDGVMPY